MAQAAAIWRTPDAQPSRKSQLRVTLDGRLYSVTSGGSLGANLPGLNNCLLTTQKVRVGVPAETQNWAIRNSTDAQKKVL